MKLVLLIIGFVSMQATAVDPLSAFVRRCVGEPAPVTYQPAPELPLHRELAFPPRSVSKPTWPVLNWPHSVHSGASLQARRAAIADYPLGAVVVKPGHNPVRDPAVVRDLMTAMGEGYRLAETDQERPKMNIRTNGHGEIVTVELLEGHHRLLALYGLGSRTVGEVPEDLDVWVDGIRVDGTEGYSKFPAHAVDFGAAHHWPALQHDYGVPISTSPSWMKRPKDAGLASLVDRKILGIRTDKGERSGELLLHHGVSNFEVGSRDTVATAYQAMSRDQQPDIGVLPLPNAEVPAVGNLSRFKGLDEVLLVPTGDTRGLVERARQLNQRLEAAGNTLRFNVYQGMPYPSYVGVFGPHSFEKRVQQMYSTSKPVRTLSR